jgi:hypothetical protein
MEKSTCAEFVKAHIDNSLTDKATWAADYPEGVSVQDILDDDTEDVITKGDECLDDEGRVIAVIAGQIRHGLSDPDNIDTQYQIIKKKR